MLVKMETGASGGGSGTFDLTAMKVVEVKYNTTYQFSNVESDKWYFMVYMLGTTTNPTIPVVGQTYNLNGVTTRGCLMMVFKIENDTLVAIHSEIDAYQWSWSNNKLSCSLPANTAYGYFALMEMFS